MIIHRVGNALYPPEAGPKIIAHVCNDVGKFGAGFARSLAQQWPEAKASYDSWFHSGPEFELGLSAAVLLDPDLWVFHMVAMRGVRNAVNQRPLRYWALGGCLQQLASYALATRASVHMPRIGTGLAGGDWNIIALLISETLGEAGAQTFVYTLPEEADHVRTSPRR